MTHTLKAALWMVGAISGFTSMAVAGRELAGDLNTLEIMLYRSIIGVVVVVAVAGMNKRLGEVSTQNLGWHLLRNVSHFTGQNLWLYGVATIPLAQVFALEFTSPLWVIALSPLVLGERLTKVGVIAAALGFIGILIVTRPSPDSYHPGLLASAVAAIGFAGSAVFTRRLTRTASITCILFWLTLMQGVFGLVLTGYDGHITIPSAASWPWVILVSVAGLGAHFCLTKALSIAPATVVMPLDFTRLPIIIVIGALLYNEAVDPFVIVGAALIFAANFYNIRHETRSGAGK